MNKSVGGAPRCSHVPRWPQLLPGTLNCSQLPQLCSYVPIGAHRHYKVAPVDPRRSEVHSCGVQCPQEPSGDPRYPQMLPGTLRCFQVPSGASRYPQVLAGTLMCNYKCILALANVVNYDRKHDATIWNVTYP